MMRVVGRALGRRRSVGWIFCAWGTENPPNKAVASLLLVAVLGAGLGACGGGTPVAVKPARVPEGIVPPRVQGDKFGFYESQSPQVKDAFANGGDNSLVADGRLWELRTGDRLIGLLQMSTLLPAVNLRNKSHRDKVVNQIMPLARDQITVDDVPVFTSLSNQKSTFLWFGSNIFFVLTIKPGSEDHLDAEGVLSDVIAFAEQTHKWKPLYFDDSTSI